jgi:hypothetical protein
MMDTDMLKSFSCNTFEHALKQPWLRNVLVKELSWCCERAYGISVAFKGFPACLHPSAIQLGGMCNGDSR